MAEPFDVSRLLGLRTQMIASAGLAQVHLGELLRFSAPITSQIQEIVRSELIRTTNFVETLKPMIDLWERSQPPNWPDELDIEEAHTIIAGEGIPLVWVPRSSIIVELTAAENRQERLQILVSRSVDVLADCELSLSKTSEDVLAGQVPLAVKAVRALAGGHHEAALALSVVVTETAISRVLDERYYDRVKDRIRVKDVDELPFTLVRLWAALLPIDRLYTKWFPQSKTDPPPELSRHVAVHAADISRYSLDNAILAMMIMTSVLRGLQEYVVEGSRFDKWRLGQADPG